MQPLPLEPGDRLMFLTDGVLERNVANVDLAACSAGAAMHPREAVQHLIQAIAMRPATSSGTSGRHVPRLARRAGASAQTNSGADS